MNSRVIPRIQRQYINPKHSTAFSSPGAIHDFYKRNFHRNIPVSRITDALTEIDSYTLHKSYQKPRHRNPFFVYALRDQIQMDLIDVSQLAQYNDNVKFLLAVIDVFSKKAWIEPMEDKSANTSLRVIKQVVDNIMPPPKAVLFDHGMEFLNAKVGKYLEEKQIKIITPNSETKAAVCERFNRSIQDLIYKYMTENETFRYVDVLESLLGAYNNRGHRTLKYLTPNKAEKAENHNQVLNALNEHYTKSVLREEPVKYKIGQTVRVKTLPGRFDRGYQERFTREHFKIIKINTRQPIPMYVLQSLNNNEIIQGGFYFSELSPIKSTSFKMTVLKSRKYKGRLQHFVKWRDFDDTHNQWIYADNVTKSYI